MHRSIPTRDEEWIRSIAVGLRPGGVGPISATFNIRNPRHCVRGPNVRRRQG
jgi:hypothetical protein